MLFLTSRYYARDIFQIQMAQNMMYHSCFGKFCFIIAYFSAPITIPNTLLFLYVLQSKSLILFPIFIMLNSQFFPFWVNVSTSVLILVRTVIVFYIAIDFSNLIDLALTNVKNFFFLLKSDSISWGFCLSFFYFLRRLRA